MVMTAFTGFPTDGHSFSSGEVGQALAGLVARTPAGLPRVGMIAAPSVAAVASSWKVAVGRFVYVHQVSGAVQFSGLSAAEQVDITPATGIPAGQARIDLICWDPVASALSVVAGVAATSPSVPSAGALAPVAQVRVNAGDGMVIAGRVSKVFALTKVGDVVIEAFPWDTGKVNVVRSEFEISAGWARLRFHVTRKTGSWVSGEVLGTAIEAYWPALVEFSPVSVTPVGPVGNVAMRPDGKLNIYTTSGTVIMGDIGWPI